MPGGQIERRSTAVLDAATQTWTPVPLCANCGARPELAEVAD